MFSKQKGTSVFQWQEDTVIVISTLSSTKPCLSFLKFLAKILGETFLMSLKSTLFPKELWKKPFISWEKQIKWNLRQKFVDKRQLKTIMPQQTFPKIYLAPFCSSKLVHSFEFSFQEIYFPNKFWEYQFLSIVNV